MRSIVCLSHPLLLFQFYCTDSIITQTYRKRKSDDSPSGSRLTPTTRCKGGACRQSSLLLGFDAVFSKKDITAVCPNSRRVFPVLTMSASFSPFVRAVGRNIKLTKELTVKKRSKNAFPKNAKGRSRTNSFVQRRLLAFWEKVRRTFLGQLFFKYFTPPDCELRENEEQT